MRCHYKIIFERRLGYNVSLVLVTILTFGGLHSIYLYLYLYPISWENNYGPNELVNEEYEGKYRLCLS